MNQIKYFLALWVACMAVFFALVSCDCGEIPLKLPASATNLQALNSPYDDWNCADPTVYFSLEMDFLFSSNRNTQGGTFDLQPYALTFSGNSFEAQIGSDQNSANSDYNSNMGEMSVVYNFAQAINTDQDELGPSILRQDDSYSSHYLVMTFTRGDSSNHDLWIMRSLDTTVSLIRAVQNDFIIQESLAVLNSTADDGYLTYHVRSHTLFFHSNRSGTYRLYQAQLPTNQSMEQWMAAPSFVEVTELSALSSSDGEERTPFIRDNTLYFISTRSGGQGGRDIWKSEWASSTGWKSPVNMGSKINSAEDEYRPVVLKIVEASNFAKILFFSSNRPGGLGAYDLYYAGIQ